MAEDKSVRKFSDEEWEKYLKVVLCSQHVRLRELGWLLDHHFDSLGLKSDMTLLNVAKIHLTNEALKGLSRVLEISTSLLELNLSSCEIVPEGLKLVCNGLSNNNTLHNLNLSSNSIGDEGCLLLRDVLCSHRTLRDLSLDDNKISDVGMHHICNILDANTTLTRLSVNDNPFGDEGASHLSRSLSRSKTLRSLRVHSCRVSLSGMQHILKGATSHASLEDLVLGDAFLSCYFDGEQMQRDRPKHEEISRDIVEFLRCTKHCRRLNVSFCRLSNDALISLCRHHHAFHLQRFVLSVDSTLSQEALDACIYWIANSSDLREFAFEFAPIDADSLHEGVRQNGFLSWFYVPFSAYNALQPFLDRNKEMKEKCIQACCVVMSIKNSPLGRDCMSVVARQLLKTRGDITAWSNEVKVKENVEFNVEVKVEGKVEEKKEENKCVIF